eukprot:UN17881
MMLCITPILSYICEANLVPEYTSSFIVRTFSFLHLQHNGCSKGNVLCVYRLCSFIIILFFVLLKFYMTPDLVLAARSCVEWRIRLYCWLGFDVNVT